nr:arginine--tRNA ligase [Pseudarcicella sp.]
MNIENKLADLIQTSLMKCFAVEEQNISLQPTKKDFVGHYTFVIFPYVKSLKKSPQEIGNAIGDYLLSNADFVQSYNLVQGFLNIELSDKIALDLFSTLFNGTNFGQLAPKNSTVMVEYSSPNTNKPLHLGHLRNNFLGFSVAQILQSAGYQVVKTNLVNDRGIHICKSMLAYQKFGEGETPQSSGLKGDHLVGKYYVIFDKYYKTEIEALIAQGILEEEAKKQAPILLEAQEMLLKWEQNHPETLALWNT